MTADAATHEGHSHPAPAGRSLALDPFPLVLLGLIAFAWLALWAWGHSSHARLLGHESLGSGTLSHAAKAVPAFLAGWVLMTVAMMLPTALPLVVLFSRATEGRDDRGPLRALLVVGYLAVWTAFGAAALVADAGLHAAAHAIAWVHHNAWIIPAGAFALAGAYQFSPYKEICLTECRSPRSFFIERWHGVSPKAEALRIGAAHGAFCVGCCAFLMLVMLAVAVGNVGWMLGLAVGMGLEKNASWGKALTAPIGVACIGVAVLVGLGGLLG